MQFLKSSLVLSTSRLKRVVTGLVVLLIFLLINLGLMAARPGLFLKITPEPVDISPVVVSARRLTTTPYQPLAPTLALSAPAAMEATVAQVQGYPAPGVATPVPGASTDFYGVDFSPGAGRIRIFLQPQNDQVNNGKPIVITVNPGRSCPYQDHRACVNAYRAGNAAGNAAGDAAGSAAGEAGNVILISVHSGIGGEAEAFRRAVEGMGVNRAGFSLKQIRSNLAWLEGATVRIQQGERAVEGLRLTRAARVPPGLIQEYFRSSAEQAMRLAASVDADLESYTHPDGPILVFETCGWKLAGEPWAPGVTNTTGSVYLGVIQIAK